MKEVLFVPKSRSLIAIAAWVLMLLCSLAHSTCAEADSGLLNSTLEFGQTCLEDAQYVLASPREWGRAEWFKAAGVAGATLVLYGADAELRERFQQNRSQLGDDFSSVLGKAGNVIYLAPALGFWYLYGKHCGDAKTQEAAFCSLESLLVAGGMTVALKVVSHRSRPDTEAGSRSFDGPGWSLDDDRLSFCSLHSAAAFAVATVVAEYYRTQRGTPVLAYSTATLVALSRINDDQHWSSDVFCGAVLGYYTAKKIVVRRMEAQPGTGETLSLTPLVTRHGPALALQCRF
jgi:membrane-associated phospholipid phosphatase